MKRSIQIFGFLAIMIFFPLLSWFYLQSGLNYQLDSRAWLKDFGEVADFKWKNYTSSIGDSLLFSKDSIQGDISIISVLGQDAQINKEIKTIVGKLNQQFGDNSNLNLMVFTQDPNSLEHEYLLSQKTKSKSSQIKYLAGNPTQIKNWVGQQLKYPETWEINDQNNLDTILLDSKTASEWNDYPFFVFIDTKNKIRGYYRLNNEMDIKKLVEHTAILLPKQKKRTIEFEREKEK